MNNVIYLPAFCSPPVNRQQSPIEQALEQLRDELATSQPKALPLYELFAGWMRERRRPEGAQVDGVWLRDQFEQFPYWRCNELLDQAMEPCRKLRATPNERLSGIRSAWPALRELVSSWAGYNGRVLLKGLAVVTGWLCVAVALILIPTFFSDFGERLSSWCGF